MRKETRMSTFANIEEARAYFVGDRFAVNAGVTIEQLGENTAVCAMDITPDHLNRPSGVFLFLL